MTVNKYMNNDNKTQMLTCSFQNLIAEHAPVFGQALDLGCGTGVEAELLARHGLEVTAIDNHPIPLSVAKSRCKGLSVTFYEKDINEFEFRNNQYDVIIALNTLSFLAKEDAQTIIGKIVTSLKIENGLTVMRLFGNKDEWVKFGFGCSFDKEQLQELLCGMKICHLEEVEGDYNSKIKKHWHLIETVAQRLPLF